ncbi:MAG: hypothetical protein N2249_00405 [Melioribacter sp.]|nr:hypothetical protein [Melioribacter sp.]
MKKKNINNIEKEDSIKNNVIFCTECGEALSLVGIEPFDIEKVKERHENCKRAGKFKGDKCAMLFIVESNEDLFSPDEEE